MNSFHKFIMIPKTLFDKFSSWIKELSFTMLFIVLKLSLVNIFRNPDQFSMPVFKTFLKHTFIYFILSSQNSMTMILIVFELSHILVFLFFETQFAFLFISLLKLSLKFIEFIWFKSFSVLNIVLKLSFVNWVSLNIYPFSISKTIFKLSFKVIAICMNQSTIA